MPRLEGLYLQGTHLSDGGLVYLEGLKTLQTLYLTSQPVTDVGLNHIKRLPTQLLGFSSTQVTDIGLANLSILKNLRLKLEGTRISGSGLAGLQVLNNFHAVSLQGATQLRDAAIPEILDVRNLTEINLVGTNISPEGFAALKTGLPASGRIAWFDRNATAAKAVLDAGGTLEICLGGTNASRPVKAISNSPRFRSGSRL